MVRLLFRTGAWAAKRAVTAAVVAYAAVKAVEIGMDLVARAASRQSHPEKAARAADGHGADQPAQPQEEAGMTPEEQERVQAMYEDAAAQGGAEEQALLGALFAEGQCVPQDYAKARAWYAKAASQGHAGAQYGLGQIFEHGLGVPRDPIVARAWYTRAAESGLEEARAALERMA